MDPDVKNLQVVREYNLQEIQTISAPDLLADCIPCNLRLCTQSLLHRAKWSGHKRWPSAILGPDSWHSNTRPDG
jgi:hypothetical protein